MCITATVGSVKYGCFVCSLRCFLKYTGSCGWRLGPFSFWSPRWLGYNCGWPHQLLGDALDAMRVKGTQGHGSLASSLRVVLEPFP
jgi:hypothetical protein